MPVEPERERAAEQEEDQQQQQQQRSAIAHVRGGRLADPLRQLRGHARVAGEQRRRGRRGLDLRQPGRGRRHQKRVGRLAGRLLAQLAHDPHHRLAGHVGRGRALLGFFLEQHRDQRVERLGQAAHPAREPRRRFVDLLLHQLDDVLGLEGELAGEHLEQHHPQAVEVGLRIGGEAPRLLGRDVFGSAGHQRGLGADLAGEAVEDHRGVLGEAEVEHLHGAIAAGLHRDEDVARLQIAVDDACFVRGGERGEDLVDQWQRAGGRHRAFAGHHRLERLALEELHHHVLAAVGEVAEADDLDDPPVLDRRERLGLFEEAVGLVFVADHLRAHDLDRDPSADHRVYRAVDDAHAAGGDRGLDDVLPDLLADQRVAGRRRRRLGQLERKGGLRIGHVRSAMRTRLLPRREPGSE